MKRAGQAWGHVGSPTHDTTGRGTPDTALERQPATIACSGVGLHRHPTSHRLDALLSTHNTRWPAGSRGTAVLYSHPLPRLALPPPHVLLTPPSAALRCGPPLLPSLDPPRPPPTTIMNHHTPLYHPGNITPDSSRVNVAT